MSLKKEFGGMTCQSEGNVRLSVTVLAYGVQKLATT